ncbi:MAG: molybdopterin-dependent oxidoreductase, partial [Tepidiformaceae bacterium]
WQGGLLTMRLFSLPGAKRRFTGSYETGSFSGQFPGVIWLADNPEPQSQVDWRLRIHGHVANESEFTYADMMKLPPSTRAETLDCTGGWYTEQNWTGVALTELLLATAPRPGAASITVTAATGYNRRFSMAEAQTAILALQVGGTPLTDEHGYPARLVMPGHRGFDWVKWVTQITVNEAGDEWQSPLPV